MPRSIRGMASSEAVSKPRKSTQPAPSAKGAGKAAPADWERIELDYRAGVKTLRQIADENGITHGAINKRAKRDGWERDLSDKIQRKADALVSKAAVPVIEVSGRGLSLHSSCIVGAHPVFVATHAALVTFELMSPNHSYVAS